MGLDWRTLSLSDYLEALEAANETTEDGKPRRASDPEKLAAVMKARMEG